MGVEGLGVSQLLIGSTSPLKTQPPAAEPTIGDQPRTATNLAPQAESLASDPERHTRDCGRFTEGRWLTE